MADLFGADLSAVNRWANEGKLPSFRTPGGQLRFHAHEIEPLLRSSPPATVVVVGELELRVYLTSELPAGLDIRHVIERGIKEVLRERARRGDR